jgi:hypothetical protein
MSNYTVSFLDQSATAKWGGMEEPRALSNLVSTTFGLWPFECQYMAKGLAWSI